MKTILTLLFSIITISLTQAEQPLKDLNVKWTSRANCLAGSNMEDKQAPGGFATSENMPQSIPTNLPPQTGKLSLFVHTNEIIPFATSYKGYALYLLNNTSETVPFQASDSRLSIIRQAMDTDGKWKPIEYLPQSWCGNSFHKVFLKKTQCWKFPVPIYHGTQKTKFRFILKSGHGTGGGTESPVLISNEFEGSLNPEQFTVKEGHKPSNLMDPYFE